ncbi:MAG: protein-glutamate O-methyltransferase CheR [Bryobacterales bacterium]|nr:protein-glutamate O-methyltransferase CheR [Bryobacterales bacterium]
MASLDIPFVETLSEREFEHVCALARRQFGLDLRRGKESLVSARLGKKMREANCKSFQEYFRYVSRDPSGQALVNLIDALTTNHTSFLREPRHFDFLRKVALERMSARERLDIWSAACSTGEEPYSICFHLLEEARKQPFQSAEGAVRVLASDISTRVLSTARQGIYAEERVQGLDEEWKRRYLLRGHGPQAGSYRIKPAVARLVEFRRLNLIEKLTLDRRFQVIFCRNVMIYFDKPTQEKVVSQLAGYLEPGGYLLVGHAESLTGISHSLEYVHPAIYRKPAGR